MDHTDVYYQLVRVEHLADLTPLVRTFLQDIGHDVVTVEIQREDDFPFIYCQLVTEAVFRAVMIGFFTDIRSILPVYQEPQYYLPVVGFCEHEGKPIANLIDKAVSIRHEVQHVKDILNLIRTSPQFLDQSYHYGLNSSFRVGDLPHSIDFEMFKIFHLEAPAIKRDYLGGDTAILMTMGADQQQAGTYESESLEEYLRTYINSYLSHLKLAYLKKFQDEANIDHRIETEMDRALARYGTDVFGPDPVQGRRDFLRDYGAKYFFQLAKMRRRVDVSERSNPSGGEQER